MIVEHISGHTIDIHSLGRVCDCLHISLKSMDSCIILRRFQGGWGQYRGTVSQIEFP